MEILEKEVRPWTDAANCKKYRNQPAVYNSKLPKRIKATLSDI